MFMSSHDKSTLPAKGDQVRYEDRGPWLATHRSRSAETGSVFLNLQHGNEQIDLVPVEAVEWWPTIGSTVSVSEGRLEQILIAECGANTMSKRLRLFFGAMDPFVSESPQVQGSKGSALLEEIKAMRKYFAEKLIINRIINGSARCSVVDDDTPLQYGLPIDCLKVVSRG